MANGGGKENGKNVEVKAVKEILNTVEKKLSETLKAIDVEEIKKTVKRVEEIEKKMKELEEEKMELVDFLMTTMETVDVELFRTLKALGINGITDVILRADEIVSKVKKETENSVAVKTVSRAKRGEGIGNRKINFMGRVYNMPQYFMRKMGITGGLEGLKKWAEENGYKVTITDDVIIIE